MNAIVRAKGARRPANASGSKLLWKTATGDVIPIEKMATSHCFNSMKMIFNHLAEMWGGKPVWFTHRYSDYTIGALTGKHELARIVVVFMQEIESRGDLPDGLRAPYDEIVAQIRSRSAPELPR